MSVVLGWDVLEPAFYILLTHLSQEEREELECDLFDRSLDKLKRHWDNVEYRKNPVKVVSHYSRQAEAPYSTEEYRRVKPIVTATSTVGLHRHPDIAGEYMFATNHCERRISMLIFTKCQNANCERCVESPAVNMDALELARHFPSPQPAEGNHLTTFLEAIADDNCGSNPGIHMPRYVSKGLGRCHICRRYIYTSNADREKHRKKAHAPQAQVLRAQAGNR